jgi:hypothetical protein
VILYKPWPDGWNYGGALIMNNYFEEHYQSYKFVIIQFPWPCHDQEEYWKCNFKDNSNHPSWVSAKEALLEVEFDYLVIYEPVEWMFYEDAIEDYYNFFESCNIPMEKIIYQGANHNMYGYYDYINLEKKKRFKSVAFNHCLISSLITHRDTLNDYTTDVKFDGSKLFICPMSTITEHRELIYNKLEENDLLKYGHVSARWKKIYIDDLGLGPNPIGHQQETAHLSSVNSIIPYYEDAFCTLVTESEYYNWNVRFTEKFYFPIMYNRPFMVLGAPGLLKWIKKYGFKTFPELWDETYDDELDLKKRTNKIIDNIKSLRGKSKSELQGLLEMVKPKIIHNKKILKKYANYNINSEHYDKLMDVMKLSLGEQVRNVL